MVEGAIVSLIAVCEVRVLPEKMLGVHYDISLLG